MDESYLKTKLEQFGEVMVVLESDREYDVHNGTVSFEGAGLSDDEFRIEGLRDSEYLVVDIPYDSIEHVYTHKEV